MKKKHFKIYTSYLLLQIQLYSVIYKHLLSILQKNKHDKINDRTVELYSGPLLSKNEADTLTLLYKNH